MKREMHFVYILFLLILSPLICVNSSNFVLIHGGSHGAWCWYKVATMLKSTGHNVTTIELAASGINSIQVQDIHSISKYYEPLMTFMESLPPNEKVILVGHSLGGVSTSVAMEMFPQKLFVAVFVTAYVLSQNLTYPAILQEVFF
jgi:pimeloyl-ACP methyl ester carboxylesterase